ncbi:SseB family protein [Puniceibacterium sediminis]|uniref:SseB protein N-terminal domain-containing protein n=1 Tax=Puniceibacterium sediminis TaxID=1608407 RepID=A0A238WLJ6_9RHOB|nr:SseB family protein [Puniceibacterium sediminis]SNR47298.1 SseB protein N-terminal domain-containing protein [Puniceibacterium sediminis]
MIEETPLDAAHAAMEAAPEDSSARLKFYERLADGELFLLLAQEPTGDNVTPELFEVSDSRFVLVFDREDRLTAFTSRAAAYAALSGRAIAGMLAGQDIGLGLNLEVAPSSILIPASAVDWLAQTLGEGPEESEARPVEVLTPKGLPDSLITALDTKLGLAAGLARKAYLAAVIYDDESRGHLLGLTGTAPGAEAALARAVNEALVFSGIEAGALDVVFLADSDPLTAKLARVGLRFDLPQPSSANIQTPSAPGSDPKKPPILR